MIDYEQLFDRSPNAYVVFDPELRIVAVNQAHLNVTLRQRDEVVGRLLFDAFPNDEASESYRQLKGSLDRVLASGETDELAHIRYDIPQPGGGVAVEYWSATHTPIQADDGSVELILQHTVNITELETLRRGGDEVGVLNRARAVEQRYQDAAEQIEQFRRLLDQAPGFVALIAGDKHRFIFVNEAYRRLLGGRPIDGKTVAETVPEVEDQGFIAILDQVFASGEPYFGRRERVIFHDEGAAAPRETFLEFIFQPITAATGEIWGILIQGHDVTDEVEAEERQRLLINELNHRVKNTLAVVQGLAQQSFGKLSDGRFQVFTSRLAALAGAHNLLTAGTWESGDLRELIYSALDATTGLQVKRCALSGPPVTLPPPLVLSLAMIIHELSTNAIKYGALSNGDGTVQISWETVAKPEGMMLMLDWNERDGPPVAPPAREGFGTRLIRRGLSGQGKAELTYRPEGLHCRIEARL